MFANIEHSLFSNITYISTVITKNLYNRIYKMICKKYYCEQIPIETVNKNPESIKAFFLVFIYVQYNTLKFSSIL